MLEYTLSFSVCLSLFLCLPASAILRYAHVGLFDICGTGLTGQNIPELLFGYIRTPNYPHPTIHPYNCAITIPVERESWMGIYAHKFELLPGENCLDSNELQITSSTLGLVKHFCGVQKGLIYRKYIPTTDSFLHLNFISRGDEADSSLFKIYYIAAKAVHVGADNSRQLEATTNGHIVSHRYFGERQGQGYATNIQSSLTLTGFEPGTKVELDFLYFDVYRQDNHLPCTDYLEILGAKESTTDSSLQRLCGSRNNSKSLVVQGDSITFMFSTGKRNNDNKGFLLQYAVTEVYEQTTTAYYSTYITNTGNEKNSTDLKSNTIELKLPLSSVKGPETTNPSPNSTTHVTPATNHILSARKQKTEGDYAIAFSAGLGSLVVVLVVVIVVVIVMQRRTRANNDVGCYADNIFAVRSLPSTFDPASNRADEDNFYYNDLEVFESQETIVQSPSSRGHCNNENIYHIIEETASPGQRCNCAMEAGGDNNEYESCAPSPNDEDLQSTSNDPDKQELSSRSLDNN